MFKCTFQATLSNTSTLEKGSARTPLYKDKRVGEHTEGQRRTGQATTAFGGAAPLEPFNGYIQACSPLRTNPAFHCWYHVFYKNNGEAQLSSKPLQWLICIVSALSLLDSPYTRRQVPVRSSVLVFWERLLRRRRRHWLGYMRGLTVVQAEEGENMRWTGWWESISLDKYASRPLSETRELRAHSEDWPFQ